jgi:hypothetical protein
LVLAIAPPVALTNIGSKRKFAICPGDWLVRFIFSRGTTREKMSELNRYTRFN